MSSTLRSNKKVIKMAWNHVSNGGSGITIANVKAQWEGNKLLLDLLYFLLKSNFGFVN